MMKNKWAVNYRPSEGGRITGHAFVDADEVRFEALYDSSNKEIIKGIFGSVAGFAASGGHAVYIHDTDTEFEVVLPRAEIATVTETKKKMIKSGVITMRDGSEFVFDFGMLSPKKFLAAING
jgi:hypothetical protein